MFNILSSKSFIFRDRDPKAFGFKDRFAKSFGFKDHSPGGGVLEAGSRRQEAASGYLTDIQRIRRISSPYLLANIHNQLEESNF